MHIAEEPQALHSRALRVLIVDFDFFSVIGGGQTFYRRMVERHPSWSFLYPSRGGDMRMGVRAGLPHNVQPFGFDETLQLWDLVDCTAPRSLTEQWYALTLTRIAAALQGFAFDVVEVPAFFPIAHLVRPIFASYGILVRRLALGLHGWLSVGLKNSYEGEVPTSVIAELKSMEMRSAAAADIRYSVSSRHIRENLDVEQPVSVVEMENVFDEFATPDAMPPGSGAPDLWFVGRLDRNKGPDLFIEIVAGLPKGAYGRAFLAGPDNLWVQNGARWSDTVLAQAEALEVDADYVGELPSETVSKRIYGSRSVVVIPSRTDAFNFVAIEALANGCPILLSNRAGAAEFLSDRLARIAPAIMDPDDIADAQRKLLGILDTYQTAATELRRVLREEPIQRPALDFMRAVYTQAAVCDLSVDLEAVIDTGLLHPLLRSEGAGWNWPANLDKSIAIVVRVRDDADGLARTLAALSPGRKQAYPVLVIDDGSADLFWIRKAIDENGAEIAFIRQGRQGFAASRNRGIRECTSDYICFLEAGEAADPARLAAMKTILDADPRCAAVMGEWSIVDPSGRALPDEADGGVIGRKAFGLGGIYRRSALAEKGGYVECGNDDDCVAEMQTHLLDTDRLKLLPEDVAWRWPIA